MHKPEAVVLRIPQEPTFLIRLRIGSRTSRTTIGHVRLHCSVRGVEVDAIPTVTTDGEKAAFVSTGIGDTRGFSTDTAVLQKGPPGFVTAFVHDWMMALGYKDFSVRGDGTLQALLRCVCGVVLADYKFGMEGLFEDPISPSATWRRSTGRGASGPERSLEVDPSRRMFAWAIRNANYLLCRHHVRADGTTVYGACFRHRVQEKLCMFGETVQVKLVEPERPGKSRRRWHRAAWLLPNGNMVATPYPATVVHDFHWRVLSERWNVDIIQKMAGLPWNNRGEGSSRRSMSAISTAGEPLETRRFQGAELLERA